MHIHRGTLLALLSLAGPAFAGSRNLTATQLAGAKDTHSFIGEINRGRMLRPIVRWWKNKTPADDRVFPVMRKEIGRIRREIHQSEREGGYKQARVLHKSGSGLVILTSMGKVMVQDGRDAHIRPAQPEDVVDLSPVSLAAKLRADALTVHEKKKLPLIDIDWSMSPNPY